MKKKIEDFLRPISYGKLKLDVNVLYAPLAGVSDAPFREMGRRFHQGLFYCEMVKMDALVRGCEPTFRLLSFSKEMHPIGAQVCGSKLGLARPSATIIEDLGFDTIDLNCGCPVDKVTKDGSGSAMLKNPDKIGEMIFQLRQGCSLPVTVKIRAGWDDQNIYAQEITKIAEQAGAKAICIHGRTRTQAYRGFSNWEHIRDAKEVANEILVIGNGDIFNREKALEIFEQTNCDGVLIARGTMGHPYVSRSIQEEDFVPPSPQTLLREHYRAIRRFDQGKKAIQNIRRVACWYLKEAKDSSKLRERINRAKTLEEIEELILEPKSQDEALHREVGV